MIDRKRVRELAGQGRARPGERLLEFVEEAEGFVDDLLALSRAGLPLPLSDEDRRRLESLRTRSHEQMWFHSRNFSMRLATRRVGKGPHAPGERLIFVKYYLDIFGLLAGASDKPSTVSYLPELLSVLPRASFDQAMDDDTLGASGLRDALKATPYDSDGAVDMLALRRNIRRASRPGRNRVPADRRVPLSPGGREGGQSVPSRKQESPRCAPSSRPTPRSGSAVPPPAESSAAPPVPSSGPVCSDTSGSGSSPACPRVTTAPIVDATAEPVAPGPAGKRESGDTASKARSDP
jgi:hypothetical protein